MADGKTPPPPLPPHEEGENANTKALIPMYQRQPHEKVSKSVTISNNFASSSNGNIANLPSSHKTTYSDVVKGQSFNKFVVHPLRPPVNNLDVSQHVISDVTLKPISEFEGKPSVIFPFSEKKLLVDKLQFVLIGKFTHGRPSWKTIMHFFVNLKLTGSYTISIYDKKHIFIECSNKLDFYRIWMKLTWFIGDYAMRVFKWTSNFSPVVEAAIVPVWVRFEGLPLYMFDEMPLLSISNSIGKPIRVDPRNVTRTIVNSARVCVELDISQPLVEDVWINFEDEQTKKSIEGFWVKVFYDVVPLYCDFCSHIGHGMQSCKRRSDRVIMGEKRLENSRQIQSLEKVCVEDGTAEPMCAPDASVELVRTVQGDMGYGVDVRKNKSLLKQTLVLGNNAETVQDINYVSTLQLDQFQTAVSTLQLEQFQRKTAAEDHATEEMNVGSLLGTQGAVLHSYLQVGCGGGNRVDELEQEIKQGGTLEMLYKLEHSSSLQHPEANAAKQIAGTAEMNTEHGADAAVFNICAAAGIAGRVCAGQKSGGQIAESMRAAVSVSKKLQQESAGHYISRAINDAATAFEEGSSSAIEEFAAPDIEDTDSETAKGIKQRDGMLFKSVFQATELGSVPQSNTVVKVDNAEQVDKIEMVEHVEQLEQVGQTEIAVKKAKEQAKTTPAVAVLVEEGLPFRSKMLDRGVIIEAGVEQNSQDAFITATSSVISAAVSNSFASNANEGAEKLNAGQTTQDLTSSLSMFKERMHRLTGKERYLAKEKEKDAQIRIVSQLSLTEMEYFAQQEIYKIFATPTSVAPAFDDHIPSISNPHFLDKDGKPVSCYEIIEKSPRLLERTLYQYPNNEKLIARWVKNGKYVDRINDVRKSFLEGIRLTFQDFQQTMKEQEWTPAKRSSRNRNRAKENMVASHARRK